MNISVEEIALGLAQEAIDNIDYMTVVEHLDFDLDIDDDDISAQVMGIISTSIVARIV